MLSSSSFRLFFLLGLPVFIALVLYHIDPSDPVAVPETFHQYPVARPSVVDGRTIRRLEVIGSGRVVGPEDLVYDPASRAVYTGTEDGWIKRVVVGDGSGPAAVEEVVNTGGRPLGLALSPVGDGYDLLIADSFKTLVFINSNDSLRTYSQCLHPRIQFARVLERKRDGEERRGLLKLTKDKELVLLTKEAEGIEFTLTDGVDVAKDGIVYFTDASSKHTVHESFMNILEGRPYGRLLSYDPATRRTKVLLRDLHFPNGVAVAPDQGSLVFCETMLRMCKRYHIAGPRVGTVDPFVNDTIGIPDNIHYDGDGRYLIGLPMSLPPILYKVTNTPLARKVIMIAEKYIGLGGVQKAGGVLAVDLAGNAVAHFYDPRLSATTSAIKIGQHLYWGSLYYQHIYRLNLTRYSF